MKNARIVAFLLSAWVFTGLGCKNQKEELEKCLPRGITLDTKLKRGWKPSEKTVGQELTSLGAVPRDGKLFDGQGVEIKVIEISIPGTPGREEWLEEQLKKVEELKKKYTVVVVEFWHL